jgi:hypothetical protein
MAIKIKSRWHNEDAERSPAEIAGTLAFISWRLAVDQAIALHGQRFIYENDAQRLAVIQEYLCFQIQILDRLAQGYLDDQDRRTLIVGLALKLAGLVQDNGQDLLGPGNHGRAFLDRLNERGAEYADFKLTSEGPSYPFLRHLGHQIQVLMGEREENRWVIDQVMDRDGAEVYRRLAPALVDLLGE